MELNYRITIFTTNRVIESDFYSRKIAISTIKEFKKRFKDFMIGILSEKVNGDWNPVCSIKSNS